jgi:hypothetical protein
VSPSKVNVKGGPRFASTLKAAERDIALLRDGFEEAGNVIADAASAAAPVLTGALAASIRSERTTLGSTGGTSITSPLAYAAPIHYGVPSHNIEASLFILRGAERSEHQWTDALERDAQKVCDSVEGT